MGLLKGACCGYKSNLCDFDVTRKSFTSCSSIFMRFPFNQNKAVRGPTGKQKGQLKRQAISLMKYILAGEVWSML